MEPVAVTGEFDLGDLIVRGAGKPFEEIDGTITSVPVASVMTMRPVAASNLTALACGTVREPRFPGLVRSRSGLSSACPWCLSRALFSPAGAASESRRFCQMFSNVIINYILEQLHSFPYCAADKIWAGPFQRKFTAVNFQIAPNRYN